MHTCILRCVLLLPALNQDLFGPANCELFEEFKILMATRANYTANASVRYAAYALFFFRFLQLKSFSYPLVLLSSTPFLSTLRASLLLFILLSSLFFLISSLLRASPLLSPPLILPPAVTLPLTLPLSYHITYPRTCGMLPPYQKLISPSAENVPHLTGPYLRVIQSPFVVKGMKLKPLY